MKNWLNRGVFTVLLSVLVGCATPPPERAPHYKNDEIVNFEGFQFEMRHNALVERLPKELGSAFVDPNLKWVVIAIVMKNTLKQPTPPGLHPKFKLISKTGAEYEGDVMAQFKANNETGYSELQPLNPQVEVRRGLLFKVPQGEFSLQVSVPTGISRTTMYSNRFIYDLQGISF